MNCELKVSKITVKPSKNRLKRFLTTSGNPALSTICVGVGIGTCLREYTHRQATSPNSSLHTTGRIATAVSVVSTTYTVADTDSIILGDATGGAFTITLPTAVGITGAKITLKKTDVTANAITIDGNAAETIDGASSYNLTAQFKYVTIVSDGTNWMIVGNN